MPQRIKECATKLVVPFHIKDYEEQALTAQNMAIQSYSLGCYFPPQTPHKCNSSYPTMHTKLSVGLDMCRLSMSNKKIPNHMVTKHSLLGRKSHP